MSKPERDVPGKVPVGEFTAPLSVLGQSLLTHSAPALPFVRC
jgi:hypothetical protein